MSLKRSARLGLGVATLGVLTATACTAIIGVDGLPDPGDDGGADAGADVTAHAEAGPRDAGLVDDAALDAGDALADADAAPLACSGSLARGNLQSGNDLELGPLAVLVADAAAPHFGASLAITPQLDGGVVWLAVGAPLAGSSKQGAVQVSEVDLATSPVMHEDYLLATAALAGDQLGSAVAFSPDGHYLAVGAPGGAAGAVDLYVYIGTCWAYVERIANPAAAPVRFGAALALTASTLDGGAELVVGAPGDAAGTTGSPAGAAYLFDVAETPGGGLPTITQSGAVSAGESGDELGFSLAASLDGRVILVGAPFGESGAGAVYPVSVARFGPTPPLPLDPDTNTAAHFGYSVAVTNDGRYGIVGSPGQNSIALLAGPQGDASVSYVTENGGYTNAFGTAVAVTPTMVYSGAPASGGAVVIGAIKAGSPPAFDFGGSLLVPSGGIGPDSGFGAVLVANDQGMLAASLINAQQPPEAVVHLLLNR